MKDSMDRNVLLKIAYDGPTFHGWQKQPGARTVQGHLEQVMSRLFNREILLSGTSRTDAGVHALGQQASFKADLGVPVEKMALVINNALCAAEGGGYAKSPIRILKAEEMPSEFHARYDSKGKKYIYRIRDGADGSESDGAAAEGMLRISTNLSLVFERNYVYHVNEILDEVAMNEAAQYFVGRHDFKSFEASGGSIRETTVRTMSEAQVERTGNGDIEFHITGNGFLYNMVRIMTGTLVEVGQGKRRPSEIVEIIEAEDRAKAGHTAPPNGLYLAEVYY